MDSDQTLNGSHDELTGNERELALTWLHRLLAAGYYEAGLDPADKYRDLLRQSVIGRISNRDNGLAFAEDCRTLRQIQKIADAISLSEIDHQLLNLMVLTRSGCEFALALEQVDVATKHAGRNRNRVAIYLMLGITSDQGAHCLSSKGALLHYGFLTADCENDLTINPSILKFIKHADEETSFIDYVVGAAKRPVFSLEDFWHLRDAATSIGSLLANAVAQKAKGINIFIYGPSGSGKTELASVIADSIGCSLYGICDSPESGEAPNRDERIRSMTLVQRILFERGSSILLIDDADDVLSEHSAYYAMLNRLVIGSQSLLSQTRMLEENTVPVIWIVNRTADVGPALLRRMSFALKMPIPDKNVRARIWDKALTASGIKATAIEVSQLAADLESGPAIAATAIRVSKMQSGGFADVDRTARSIASAMQGGRPIPKKAVVADFDMQLVCGGREFETLYQRASEWSESSASFCTSGPSGTGKSLALRALAKRMNRDVMGCRASNLLGMSVGETRANIADAFSRAESEGLFLIIDEAEILLGDRRRAERNWEASMTAEFLTWMERHPLPFGVTTNHIDLIDADMLRRFTFKLSFEPMNSQQRNKAFERFFGAEAPPGLLSMQGLTAGDFAVTAKRARLMGFVYDAAQCLNALREELDAKG